jgi:alpha 1,6-mannosyltransferase
MLLSSRPSSFKLFSSVTLISLAIVLFLNLYIFNSTSGPRYFDPFRTATSCDSDTTPKHGSVSAAQEPVVTVTMSLLPPPVAAPTPTIISVTITSSVVSMPTPTSIPEKIWYKLGPKGLSKDAKQWIDSCLTKNPTFRHEFLTDSSGDYYVQEYFSYRRDIVDTYLSLSVPILKADMLRYLILFAEGGMWSDLDVSCEDTKSIREWVPDQYKEDTNLVVGLEFDWAWENDNFLHSQFASWTILARPGSPHMLQTIDDIISGVKQKADEHHVEIKDLTYEMVGEVVDMTGPKRMTRSIVSSLEKILGRTIDDRDISGLKEPKLIGDVLILPGNSFGASQNGNPKDQGPKLVEHHYAGTWKNDHGGELA